MYPLTQNQTFYELKHIVYVDDDEEDRIFFRETLNAINNNIKISEFENGYDLIRFLQGVDNQNQLPCSIICDMKMPLLSGIDLLKRLKQESKWQHIPVIIFSTSSNSCDSHNSMESGATAFFSKPNSLTELKEVVTRILGLCSETLSVHLRSEPIG